jgi:hypothetical protein
LIQAIEGGSVDLAIVDPFFSRRLKQKGYKIMLELHRSNIPFHHDQRGDDGNLLGRPR